MFFFFWIASLVATNMATKKSKIKIEDSTSHKKKVGGERGGKEGSSMFRKKSVASDDHLSFLRRKKTTDNDVYATFGRRKKSVGWGRFGGGGGGGGGGEGGGEGGGGGGGGDEICQGGGSMGCVAVNV